MIAADKQLIDKVNRLIDDNLDNSAFSVDVLCQRIGVSRSHLHRVIKEQTDLSTSLYIRKRRLLKAQHLLITTELRIAEIGDIVGMSNPQNFSTYFIDEFKVSPTEFRKLHTRSSPNVVDAVLPPEPVQEVVPELVQDNTPNQILRRRPESSFRRKLILGGAVIGLVLFFCMGYHVWNTTHFVEPVRNSLVVLPFINLGGADSDPACEGIMDDVHRSVSRIKNLKVIARSSSDQYKSTKKSIWQIGDELQATNILKGSVLKTGNQIQVKVDIIGAKDDILLWSRKYNGDYKDIFQLTDQIVQEVADQLKMPINTPGSGKLALVRTQHPDAYNALLQGRQLMISRKDADLLESIARFDRALALDSTFAEAYGFKAAAYHLLQGSEKINKQTVDRLTEENALKAIRLDPTNSTAYGVLGSLYYSTYQWQASENAFRIALQCNPNDAQASHWYSLLLRTTGRFDEAVKYSALAIALDPLHPIMMGAYIINCSYANRFDLARAGIETGRGLFDNSFSYQMAKANYWMCQADYNRAVAGFQQARTLNPDDKGQIPVLIYCEAKRGNQQRAVTFLHTLKETTPRANYERAVVYAGLNQADSSLHYLKKAADGAYLYRDTKALPVFKPYRSHPIFKAILRQYHLPEN